MSLSTFPIGANAEQRMSVSRKGLRIRRRKGVRRRQRDPDFRTTTYINKTTGQHRALSQFFVANKPENIPIAAEELVLNTYFDQEMERAVPGYLEDAYGCGRCLRRIWYFAKEGAYREYEWKFLDRLIEEWAER